MSQQPPNLGAAAVRAISVTAGGADPRTIRKFLSGKRVRGYVADRIAIACAQLGVVVVRP